MRVPPPGGDFSSSGPTQPMPLPKEEARRLSQYITKHLQELYTASKDGTLTPRALRLAFAALRGEIEKLRELEQKFPKAFTLDQKQKTEDLNNMLQRMAGQMEPPTMDQFHEALQMAQDLKF